MNRVARLLVCSLVLSSCNDSATEPNPEPDTRPTFVAIAAGGATVCGLTTEGNVYCWGARYDTVPTLVPGGRAFHSIAVSEAGEYDALGNFHACGIEDSGQAYCWGDNQWGQLGHSGENWVPEPTAVPGGMQFVQLAAGQDNTCGIVADGGIYCWGQNGDGHLGTTPGQRTDPTRLPGDLTFRYLTSGRWFKCGITLNDETYCWGDDYLGQLGDGSDGLRVNPTPSRVVGVTEISTVSSGWEHTCALTTVGSVAVCWGENHLAQLNDGTTINRDSAVVSGLALPSFVFVDAGSGGTCGLTPEGSTYCWGALVSHAPSEPEYVAGLPQLTSVRVGGYFACGLSVDGWVYCWGLNDRGQLGRSWEDDRWSRLDPAPITYLQR